MRCASCCPAPAPTASVGLKRIKELGGVTLVQSPDDAEHDGMPSAAIATGLVDFVLDAAAMPGKLLQIAANAEADPVACRQAGPRKAITTETTATTSATPRPRWPRS